MSDGQIEVNDRFWSAGGQVGQYDSRALLPAEALMLVRQRAELAGRVLEIGIGAGRILSYLVEFGGEVHGIDISADMVDYCRAHFPAAQVRMGDLRNLRAAVDGEFTGIVAADNVLDVLDNAARRAVFGDLRDILAPDGVLAFSTHNLAFVTGGSPAGGGAGRLAALMRKAADRPPRDVARVLGAMPRRRANRRRLAGHEHREDGYAVLNDEAHDFNLLHYYVGRDRQAEQLAECGLELMECREASGELVPPGSDGSGPWLFYIARRGV